VTGSAGRARQPRLDGQPSEVLTLAEAARIVGVSARYLRRLGRRPAGDRRDRLAAVKDPTSGRWVVRREELERFLAEREPPTVVLGYDLTCSAPKSVSLLWVFGDQQLRADIAAALNAGSRRRSATWSGTPPSARSVGGTGPASGSPRRRTDTTCRGRPRRTCTCTT
jgi:TrwC relaxase/Helix-turn-helix domain